MSPEIYGDRWWSIPNETYTVPTSITPSNLKIPWISITPISTTSALIRFGVPPVTPGSYGGSAAGSGTFNDPDFVFTTSSTTYTVQNLTPGSSYYVRARAWSGAGATGTYGEYIYESFTMPKIANVVSTSSTVSSTTTPSTSTTDELTKSKLEKILAEEAAFAATANGSTENFDLSNSTMFSTEKIDTSTAFS